MKVRKREKERGDGRESQNQTRSNSRDLNKRKGGTEYKPMRWQCMSEVDSPPSFVRLPSPLNLRSQRRLYIPQMYRLELDLSIFNIYKSS